MSEVARWILALAGLALLLYGLRGIRTWAGSLPQIRICARCGVVVSRGRWPATRVLCAKCRTGGR